MNVNARDKNDTLPAMIAAINCSDSCCKLLLESGTNINLCTFRDSNVNLLHILAENNLIDSLRYLVEYSSAQHEAKKYLCTESVDGNLPIHYAAMSGNKDIILLIQEYFRQLFPPSVSRDIQPALPPLPPSPSPLLGQQVRSGNESNVIDIEAEDSAQLPTDKSKYVALSSMSLEAILADGALRLKAWQRKHIPEEPHQPASANDPNENNNRRLDDMVTDLRRQSLDVTDAKREEAERLKTEGNNFFQRKEYAQAIERYSEAIRLVPSQHVYYSNRSAAYLNNGDREAALRDAEVCRALEPGWARGCLRLATARHACGMYEDAAVAAYEGEVRRCHRLELRAALHCTLFGYSRFQWSPSCK